MGLRQEILSAPVTELEWRPLIIAKPTDLVRDAIPRMRKAKLGCAVVVSADGKAIGKFTERDIIRTLLISDDFLDQHVGQNMSGNWGKVHENDTIAGVIERMENSKLRFMVVVDDNDRPIGLTGQKGVIEYIVEHFPRQVKVQMMEAKLFMDQREGG